MKTAILEKIAACCLSRK